MAMSLIVDVKYSVHTPWLSHKGLTGTKAAAASNAAAGVYIENDHVSAFSVSSGLQLHLHTTYTKHAGCVARVHTRGKMLVSSFPCHALLGWGVGVADCITLPSGLQVHWLLHYGVKTVICPVSGWDTH
jgi:hypothetical protein